MNTLATYLWKEWRDQRSTVFGILGVQLLTCVLLVLFLQDTVFASTGMVTAVTFGSIALTLVVFGPELVSGEHPSGTLGFLGRMPSGLHWAFWAKVVFLLAAMVSLVCTGFAISSGFYIATGQSWDVFVPQTLFSNGVIPGVVTLGLLLMAVSCWLPRAILTIPTTTLLSALLILPVYFIWSTDLSLVHYVSLEVPLYFAPPLALGILWLSLVHGRAAGRGPRDSAGRGLLACVLAATPLWAWAGVWMHEWTTPRPRENLRIWNAYMGTDGKLAFLNTSRRNVRGPWMSLVVDLETGEWKHTGQLNDAFAPIGWNDRFPRLEFGEHSLLEALPRGSEVPDSIHYIDGATGEVVPQVHPDGTYAGILSRARKTARRRSPFRTPDGRRVWALNGNLEIETEAGGFERLPWDRRDQVFMSLGYGLGIFDGGWTVPYDFTRLRRFADRRFLLGCCWVLETHWLVSDRERTRKPPTIGRHFNWRLLDPETGEEETAKGMIDGDRVTAILDDGRVLVQEAGVGDSTAMVTVDPFSGTREPLIMNGLAVARSVHERSPMRTPDGRRLLRKGFDLTSLAPGSNTLTPPVPMTEVIGCFDATTVLILSRDRRRLERVNLLTGESEVVFPR